MFFRRLFGTLVLAIITATSAFAQVTDISAIINAAQEVPAPSGVNAGAAGFASLQLDEASKELLWNIAWQDLTGAPVGMHIHAAAVPGATSGVVVNLGDISGLTSPSVGSTMVSDDVIANLLAGESYINIHTAANGPGEIRGQINPTNINMMATLNAAQEVPTPNNVPAGAGGMAHIAYDPATQLLGWNISWDNLSGPPVGMHFHGPAGFGETAGVLLNIGEISGLTSPSIGSAVVDDAFVTALLDSEIYINVHTAENGPGEIRGQVIPEPSSCLLALVASLGCMTLRRRRA